MGLELGMGRGMGLGLRTGLGLGLGLGRGMKLGPELEREEEVRLLRWLEGRGGETWSRVGRLGQEPGRELVVVAA